MSESSGSKSDSYPRDEAIDCMNECTQAKHSNRSISRMSYGIANSNYELDDEIDYLKSLNRGNTSYLSTDLQKKFKKSHKLSENYEDDDIETSTPPDYNLVNPEEIDDGIIYYSRKKSSEQDLISNSKRIQRYYEIHPEQPNLYYDHDPLPVIKPQPIQSSVKVPLENIKAGLASNWAPQSQSENSINRDHEFEYQMPGKNDRSHPQVGRDVSSYQPRNTGTSIWTKESSAQAKEVLAVEESQHRKAKRVSYEDRESNNHLSVQSPETFQAYHATASGTYKPPIDDSLLHLQKLQVYDPSIIYPNSSLATLCYSKNRLCKDTNMANHRGLLMGVKLRASEYAMFLRDVRSEQEETVEEEAETEKRCIYLRNEWTKKKRLLAVRYAPRRKGEEEWDVWKMQEQLQLEDVQEKRFVGEMIIKHADRRHADVQDLILHYKRLLRARKAEVKKEFEGRRERIREAMFEGKGQNSRTIPSL